MHQSSFVFKPYLDFNPMIEYLKAAKIEKLSLMFGLECKKISNYLDILQFLSNSVTNLELLMDVSIH